jgi:hypothetical protein
MLYGHEEERDGERGGGGGGEAYVYGLSTICLLAAKGGPEKGAR